MAKKKDKRESLRRVKLVPLGYLSKNPVMEVYFHAFYQGEQGLRICFEDETGRVRHQSCDYYEISFID